MTTVDEEVREGSPALSLVPDAGAQSAQRARSLPLPSPTSLQAVTQRVRRAGEFASLLAAMANKPGTMLHSQPPTFWQAWDRHRECAGHFSAPVLKALRLTWGVLHLLTVLPPLYLLAWVTESPLRFFLTAVLIAAIWFWS